MPKKIIHSLILVVTVVAALAAPQSVSADTANILPNGDGTAGNWTSTGGTYYTEVDEGTTADPLDNLVGPANNAGSIYLQMDTIPNVQNVSQVVVWVNHNDGSNGQLSAQLYNQDETTTYSANTALTQRTSSTWDSVTFSGLTWTNTELDSLAIRLTASKNGGGPPANIAVNAVYVEVTYTPAAAVSISLNSDGSVSLGNMALNSTVDTTASGLNDVEVISIDSGPADLDVRSTAFSDGLNTWTLGTASGADQVHWEFSPDGSSWTSFAVADTLYSLATALSQSSTQELLLRLTSPTSTSSFSQHSSTITVVASSP